MASKTKKKTAKKTKSRKPKPKKKKAKTVKKKSAKRLRKKTAKRKPASKKAKAKKAKARPKKSAKSKKKPVSKKSSARKAPVPASSVKKKLVVQKHDPTRLDPIVAKIRDKLIQERNELMLMIRSSQEVERNVGELTFSNEIDLASSLEGREMAFQLSSRERNELKMIEEALFKIKTGTYGICEGCSRKIGSKRLQIMPLTPLCIDCQESLEVS